MAFKTKNIEVISSTNSVKTIKFNQKYLKHLINELQLIESFEKDDYIQTLIALLSKCRPIKFLNVYLLNLLVIIGALTINELEIESCLFEFYEFLVRVTIWT